MTVLRVYLWRIAHCMYSLRKYADILQPIIMFKQVACFATYFFLHKYSKSDAPIWLCNIESAHISLNVRRMWTCRIRRNEFGYIRVCNFVHLYTYHILFAIFIQQIAAWMRDIKNRCFAVWLDRIYIFYVCTFVGTNRRMPPFPNKYPEMRNIRIYKVNHLP